MQSYLSMNRRNNDWPSCLLALGVVLVLGIGGIALAAALGHWLYNLVAVNNGWATINYWTAFGLAWLIALVGGLLRGGAK